METKRLRLTAALIVLVGLALLAPTRAWAWGAIWNDNRSTHVYILDEAYKLLLDDPAYRPGCFLPRTGVLGWEGITITRRGPGPDGYHKTLDSAHYYNPKVGVGGAPGMVRKEFMALLNGIGTGANRRRALKGAAWAGHFLADMRVPFHVMGIPLDQAREMYAQAGGKNATKLPLTPKIMGSLHLGYLESLRENDFLQDIRAYFKAYEKEKKHTDWFDPWYYNGVVSGSSSHITWEIRAYGEHRGPPMPPDLLKNQIGDPDPSVGPEADRIYREILDRRTGSAGTDGGTSFPDQESLARIAPVNPERLVFGKNIGRRAELMEQYTRDVALVTWKLANRKPEYCLSNPKALINAAIKDVYLMWRSTISALRPFMTIEPDPEGRARWRIRTAIKNLAKEDVTGVRLRLKVQGGQLVGPAELKVGSIGEGKLRSISTQWRVKNPGKDFKATLEVVGRYLKTPDLQYAKLEKKAPKNDFPRVYEGLGTYSKSARLGGKCKDDCCHNRSAYCKDTQCRIRLVLDAKGRAKITLDSKSKLQFGDVGVRCVSTPGAKENYGGGYSPDRKTWAVSYEGLLCTIKGGFDDKYAWGELSGPMAPGVQKCGAYKIAKAINFKIKRKLKASGLDDPGEESQTVNKLRKLFKRSKAD